MTVRRRISLLPEPGWCRNRCAPPDRSRARSPGSGLAAFRVPTLSACRTGRSPPDLTQYIERDDAAGTMTVRDEGLAPAFYHDCSPEDIAFARARLVPQPMRAAGPQPRPLTRERFGSIPRAYIECLQDRAISA